MVIKEYWTDNVFTIADLDQIHQHQGQASGDEGAGPARKKARLELQKQGTQGLNTIEASDIPLVASQSSDGSHMIDDMIYDMTSGQSTSQGSAKMGDSEFVYRQHRPFASAIRGQDNSSMGVMDRGHPGVGYRSYTDTTASSKDSGSLVDTDGYHRLRDYFRRSSSPAPKPQLNPFLSRMSCCQDLEDGEDTPRAQVADIDAQLVYSSPGPQYGSDEGLPQAGSTFPRSASLPMDRIVTEWQGVVVEQHKQRYLCVLFGSNCSEHSCRN